LKTLQTILGVETVALASVQPVPDLVPPGAGAGFRDPYRPCQEQVRFGIECFLIVENEWTVLEASEGGLHSMQLK